MADPSTVWQTWRETILKCVSTFTNYAALSAGVFLNWKLSVLWPWCFYHCHMATVVQGLGGAIRWIKKFQNLLRWLSSGWQLIDNATGTPWKKHSRHSTEWLSIYLTGDVWWHRLTWEIGSCSPNRMLRRKTTVVWMLYYQVEEP